MNSLHLKLNTSSDTNNPSKPQDQQPLQTTIPVKTDQPIQEATQHDNLKPPNQKDEISNLKNSQTAPTTFPALM
jgi:hypothetical protein